MAQQGPLPQHRRHAAAGGARRRRGPARRPVALRGVDGARRGQPLPRHLGGDASRRRRRAAGPAGPVGHVGRPHEHRAGATTSRTGSPASARRLDARGRLGGRAGRDAQAGHGRHGVRRGDAARLGPRPRHRPGPRFDDDAVAQAEAIMDQIGTMGREQGASASWSRSTTTPPTGSGCSPRAAATPGGTPAEPRPAAARDHRRGRVVSCGLLGLAVGLCLAGRRRRPRGELLRGGQRRPREAAGEHVLQPRLRRRRTASSPGGPGSRRGCAATSPRRTPAWSWCSGPGSAAMHATQTAVGGRLDMASMYLVASFIAAYAVMRWWRRGPAFSPRCSCPASCCACWSGSTAARCRSSCTPATCAFAVLLVTGVVLEVLIRRRGEARLPLAPAGAALGCMLVAFAVWNAGQHGLCDPDSLVQGHAGLAPAGRGGGVLPLPRLRGRDRPRRTNPVVAGSGDEAGLPRDIHPWKAQRVPRTHRPRRPRVARTDRPLDRPRRAPRGAGRGERAVRRGVRPDRAEPPHGQPRADPDRQAAPGGRTHAVRPGRRRHRHDR